MARPKKENKKDIQYRVRLDANTAAMLESLHKQSGMGKAWIIRELIYRAYWGYLPPVYLNISKEKESEDEYGNNTKRNDNSTSLEKG